MEGLTGISGPWCGAGGGEEWGCFGFHFVGVGFDFRLLCLFLSLVNLHALLLIEEKMQAEQY